MRFSIIALGVSCGNTIIVQADVTPLTTSNIKTAVHTWMKNPTLATEMYGGHISTWDTSQVTSMTTLFAPTRTVPELETFNEDISQWDTSNVVDFIGLFDESLSFNVDIGNWNTSSCTSMFGMFGTARSFNQDIGKWDVSNVQDFQSMFAGATSFNQNLNEWDIAVTSSSSPNDDPITMFSMFYGATNFSQTICWNTLQASAAELFNTTYMFCKTNNAQFDTNCTNSTLVELSRKNCNQSFGQTPPTSNKDNSSPTMAPTMTKDDTSSAATLIVSHKAAISLFLVLWAGVSFY